MKKITALFLCLVLILSLAACVGNGQGSAEEPTESTNGMLQIAGEGFRVGFGRACITPKENLPLGGYGTAATRIMTDVLDDTYVDCIAMTDENDYTVLLMLVDLQRIADDLILELRQSVTQATGIPGERIIISCSHTHSIPDLTWNSHEGIVRYKMLLSEQFAAAALQAVQDSLPTQIYSGSIETEQMTFIKHYYSVDADGNINIFGDNFGSSVMDETTQHVAEAMESMRVLKFEREGGKDVVICSFQSHPHFTGGASVTDLSSDYVGPFREAVEWSLDAHCAFIQGTSGNLNEKSRILKENIATDTTHRQYGARLAQYCVDCVQNNMQPVEAGLLQCKIIPFTAKVDHSEDDKLVQAMQVSAFKSQGASSAATNEYAAQFGISSSYHASAIKIKHGMADTQQIELGVLSIGDAIGFYVAPGELFSQCGQEMETASPFDTTIAVCLADGDWKYFPYGVCAEYRSYESDYGRFEKGTCEQMMEVWLNEFNKMYNDAKGE